MPTNGSAQCRALNAYCKAIGDWGLINRTRATLRAQGKPLTTAAQAEARRRLPRSGGLNEHVAAERWTVSMLTGARRAGVYLKTTGPSTQQTNDGYVRHPTFGRRGKGEWRTEQLPQAAGWATDTIMSRGPQVAAALAAELNVVADEVARAVGF